MAKSERVMATTDKESAPCLYLRDGQIEKYMGEDLSTLNIGDEKDISVRVKVIGLSQRKEREYSDGDKEGTEKTHKSIDLELVGKESKAPESRTEKALKTLGKGVKWPV